MVTEQAVDLMGNPTWRVTASRTDDFVWTAGAVSVGIEHYLIILLP